MGFKPEGTDAEAHGEACHAKGRGYSLGMPSLAGSPGKQAGPEQVLPSAVQKEKPC